MSEFGGMFSVSEFSNERAWHEPNLEAIYVPNSCSLSFFLEEFAPCGKKVFSHYEMEIDEDSHVCRLLSLPPEIRNVIYRYALVEGRFDIRGKDSHPPQPGLLQANRHFRRETLQIYYKENKFKWHMRDFDSENFVRWCHLWLFKGACNWQNLLRWLEAVYKQQCDSPIQRVGMERPNSNGRSVATVQFFKAVHDMGRDHNLSWDQVKVNLETMRVALAAVNKRWA